MIKHILLLTLLIPLVALPADESLHFDGMRYRGTIEKEFKIHDGGKLIMKDITADVSVTGEARDNIVVTEKYSINAYSEASARKILQEECARYIHKGQILTVEGKNSSRRFDSNFYIKVPHKTRIDITTSGGDLIVESIMDKVELQTSGGDIDGLNIRGDVSMQTSGGDIDLRECFGNVRTRTSGGDIELSKINGNLFAHTSGGDIIVKVLQGDGEIRTSGGDIYLHRIVGNSCTAHTSGGDIGADEIETVLKLTTSGGDITVNASTHNLEAHTSGGDVAIGHVEGSIKASTSGGDINVKAARGICKLKTSGGDIELGRGEDNIEAVTSGGDIFLANAFGAVYARTSGGDIELEKKLISQKRDNTIDLSSSGGDLMLYLPDDIQADLSAEIIVYNKWGDNEIDSDFSLDISKEYRGSKIRLFGQGRINGGGDKISLHTVDGDIKIKRTFK